MMQYLVPDWLNILLKSYSTQIASLGVVAQLVLDYGFSITLPWWVNALLFGAVVVGRLVPQEAVSGKKEEPDYGAGI